jgi:hypothetical protein
MLIHDLQENGASYRCLSHFLSNLVGPIIHFDERSPCRPGDLDEAEVFKSMQRPFLINLPDRGVDFRVNLRW